MVRIKDIARKAQVSVGTVDRVLHNRGRVANDVRLRILKITEDLNYKPNLSARALATNKLYRIAVLTPDNTVNTYWQSLKDGVAKAAAELTQYRVLVTHFIFDPSNAESFSQIAEQVLCYAFDGILLAPVFHRQSLSYFSKWQQAGIPVVLVDSPVPDFEPLLYIGQDPYQSGLLAGKILHFGCQQTGNLVVAHIGEDGQASAHLLRKEQGCKDYFIQNGFDIHYHVQAITFQTTSCATMAGQLEAMFENTPELTSIFVTNSQAHVVAEYLHQNPRYKVNLIGYDLTEKNIHYLETGIISFLINQNPKGQGYSGIHTLADHLIFPKNPKRKSSIKYLPLDIITKENLQYYIETDDRA